MTLSKLISLTDQDQYKLWSVPELNNSNVVQVSGEGLNHEDLFRESQGDRLAVTESTQSNEFKNGFKQGYDEGLKHSAATFDIEVEQFRTLLQAMIKPLARVNDAVERELVELSVAIAKLILRREISEHPEQLLVIAREAIRQLPAASLSIAIHLHPQDAIIFRQVLTDEQETQQWRIEEDTALSRGDCHIITDTSFVDAGIDGLADRLAQDMLGSYQVTDFSETKKDDTG